VVEQAAKEFDFRREFRIPYLLRIRSFLVIFVHQDEGILEERGDRP